MGKSDFDSSRFRLIREAIDELEEAWKEGDVSAIKKHHDFVSGQLDRLKEKLKEQFWHNIR